MSKVLKNSPWKNIIYSKYTRNSFKLYTSEYMRHVHRLKHVDVTGSTSPLFSMLIYNKRYYCSAEYPSHNRVLLPALSPTMDLGTIVSWAKKEGDKLNEGDLLAEIETDKATMGFETPEEGYLAKILVPAGTKDVPIGKLVCIIVENEADVAAFNNYIDDTLPVTKSQNVQETPQPPQFSTVKSPLSSPPQDSFSSSLSSTSSASRTFAASDRIFASPLVKKLAKEQGIDLSSIGPSSGLFGSVKVRDLIKGSKKVESKQSIKSAPDESYEDFAISNVRQVIAKRLSQSKQMIPHYYLNVDLNLDEIIKVRKKLNEDLEKDGVKLTINDFIIKATALACKKVPEANSAWMDTFIRQYSAVDVSVAVNTEKGLMTPIILDAERKGLVEISMDVKKLARKAREGKLQPNEFQGGTISVSNLGMFNIKSVSSIINPPQACILGIGSIQKRLIPDSLSPNGLRVADFIQFTLSCDHRVVDGAVGAQWLLAFRKLIEQPQNMLL